MHINASVTHTTISGLKRDTKYEVKLFLRNVAGYGNAHSQFFKTPEKDSFRTTSPSSHNSQSSIGTTVVGVVATFFALSLLLNFLFGVYIWNNLRGTSSPSKRKNHSIYDNEIDMDSTPSQSVSKPHVPKASQPTTAEYEAVQPSRVQPQYRTSSIAAGKYEVPGRPDNEQTSQDQSVYQEISSQDPSLYQQLSPTTKTPQHDALTGIYEPLHSRPMDVNTGAQHDSSEHQTYEPLRNRRTESLS